MGRLDTVREHSELLVSAAKSIKVLTAISWPAEAADRVLASWTDGSRGLPVPEKPKPISRRVTDKLDRVIDASDRGDPLGRYLAHTALSYRRTADLLVHSGTPDFHRLSRELYGGPGGKLAGAKLTHREVADRLLTATDELAEAMRDQEEDETMGPEELASRLRKRFRGFFRERIRVVVDPSLMAKAAASSTRVRLRADAVYTALDAKQLAEHEVFVHSLTALNGRKYQPHLTALGLGSPRTTATQEGLATFAELVTGAIDLARLRRIALRIRAIHAAEEGADIYQLIDSLVQWGEPPEEAVYTAMRVYRGGDPRGRWVFTKDVVYLKGLFAVHTFLRKAIAERRPEIVPRLFVGRLTLGDVLNLEESFENGDIAEPEYVPDWARKQRSIAAFLAVSALVDHVDLHAVDLVDVPRVVSPRAKIRAAGQTILAAGSTSARPSEAPGAESGAESKTGEPRADDEPLAI